MKTRLNAERARDRILLTLQQALELIVDIEKMHKKISIADAKDGTDLRRIDCEMRCFYSLDFAFPSPSQGRDCH